MYIYVSRKIFTLRFSVHVGHMEMRPRLRAPYDILEEREIELMTPMCKASGLHIHYNTAIVYDPGNLARGGGGPGPTARKQLGQRFFFFNLLLLYTTLTNSVDPDEMSHNAAFH